MWTASANPEDYEECDHTNNNNSSGTVWAAAVNVEEYVDRNRSYDNTNNDQTDFTEYAECDSEASNNNIINDIEWDELSPPTSHRHHYPDPDPRSNTFPNHF